MPNDRPRLQRSNDRVALLGRNGSGKSTMAAFLLSEADIDRKPWIIVDYKGEEIFDKISSSERDAINDLEVNEEAPKKPGLYRVEPTPGADDDAMEKMLWRIWERQRTGIYIDEAHLLPDRSDAFKALLVTGRSRQIPMMVVSQRPVWVPREVFSESNHHIVFDMSRYDDRKMAGSFVDPDGEALPRLKAFHSIWNDVRQNRRFQMGPAPLAAHSIIKIVDRAPRRFRWM